MLTMKAISALLAVFVLAGAATSDATEARAGHGGDWDYPGMMGMGHHGMMGMGHPGMMGMHHGMMGGMMGGPGGMGMGQMGMMGGDHSRQMMLMIMAAVDANSDGALSLEEVQAVHSRMFNYIDTSKDGRVTMDELQAAFGMGAAPMGGAAPQPAAPAQQ
jgi:hypothetical protein